MYRYIVDDVITYTPDDLVLFRESPFAVWMERLTLENPDHGIPPDLDSIASYQQSTRPDPDIVATLRVEGRNVILIDHRQEEPVRRAATLEAMRSGADFIVSGQLAAGNLSGVVDLLMRTSGFSELGDFLYIPCDTRAHKSLESAFRLCFVADLLASVQGQLPPQMLIIRDGAEVIPLQTEDNIYYYRAVHRRFLAAMNEFRKHHMPDPGESAHFGRWAECASEVLKQRASTELQREEQQQAEQEREQHEQQSVEALAEELPQLRVASGAGARAQYDRDVTGRAEFPAASNASRSRMLENTVSDRSDSGPTLAEQARMLRPGSYRNGTPPGHTPSLARIGKPRIVAAESQVNASTAPAQSISNDSPPILAAGLQTHVEANVELIGGSAAPADEAMIPDIGPGESMRPAPAPNLRVTAQRQSPVMRGKADVVHLPELEPRPPVFLPPDLEPNLALGLPVSPPGERLHTQVRDQDDSESNARSAVDLDSAPASTLAPVVQRAEAVFERLLRDDPMFAQAKAKADGATSKARSAQQVSETPASPFSNSLQTSEEFNDS
jgi:hypothetical protein